MKTLLVILFCLIGVGAYPAETNSVKITPTSIGGVACDSAYVLSLIPTNSVLIVARQSSRSEEQIFLAFRPPGDAKPARVVSVRKYKLKSDGPTPPAERVAINRSLPGLICVTNSEGKTLCYPTPALPKGYTKLTLRWQYPDTNDFVFSIRQGNTLSNLTLAALRKWKTLTNVSGLQATIPAPAATAFYIIVASNKVNHTDSL